jgi:hypothetical protein
MFDAEQYVARMNEAGQRASIAPTDETRLSWQNIQQGWEAVIRIQKEILKKPNGVTAPAQEPAAS